MEAELSMRHSWECLLWEAPLEGNVALFSNTVLGRNKEGKVNERGLFRKLSPFWEKTVLFKAWFWLSLKAAHLSKVDKGVCITA